MTLNIGGGISVGSGINLGAEGRALPAKAIFGYGQVSGALSMTNLVSDTGVVSNDVTGVGTARLSLAAAGYGLDKAIFGYGVVSLNDPTLSITNLVSNTGVVSNDVTGVGTARCGLAASGYGLDKAIFGYGSSDYADYVSVSMTNLVSNTGVVASDTTGVGTARFNLAAACYGLDKAIFGYGVDFYGPDPYLLINNLVSNTGVVSNDVAGVGTVRDSPAAASYGFDKAIFGYGQFTTSLSSTNLVSNTGVVSNDVTGVGTGRFELAAAGYGFDKAIFGYGADGYGSVYYLSMTNLVSNTGVVSNDVTGVGTARELLAAASYG